MIFFSRLSDKIKHAAENDIIFPKESREQALNTCYLFLLFVLIFIKLEPYIMPQLDDMTHASMGISILQTGDWFTMHEGGMISWLKPPLYFWMEAVLFKVFGVSEYWARFPAAVTGFLTFLLSYKTASKLFSKRAGFLTLFVMSSSLYFLSYTQRVMLDMPVTFAVVLSIFSVVKAEKENNDKFYLLYGLGLAFGYYFKGIQGLYALGIIPLYFIFTGQSGKLFNAYFLISILCAVFLIGLWFVPQYTAHGREFLLSQSGVGPLLTGGLAGHENPFYSPLKNLFRMFYWTIPAFYGMLLGFNRLKNKNERNGFILLFLWFFVIISALSASSVFGVRYLIPAFAPAAIFAALALEKHIPPQKFPYFQHIVCLLAGVILFFAAIFPLPAPKGGSEYISLYRCVNSIVDSNSRLLLYKERIFIFNQGLTFYSLRPLDKQVNSIEELLSEIRKSDKTAFVISNAQDYKEIQEAVPAGKLHKSASSDEWILFQIRL
ncbi:MAG TPA: hypothetical protein DCL44_00400 [Elusimicrobia bacterium]|nr:hypothetical protein [Elusimicrobiota bacterium]